MASLLFSPIRLRGVELANRIMVSPMGQHSAERGNATAWHMVHLGSLAISGAGLLMTEATAAEPSGRSAPNDLGLWCDENAAALEPVIAFCRAQSSVRLGIQLFHAGRKGSVSLPWHGQKPLAPDQGGWPLAHASPLAYPGRDTPIGLDQAGISAVVDSFVTAARRADALGFDVLELHAAHGYLIHGFLSPLTNQRNDGYGGDRHGRMRMALELFRAVRDAWPDRKPIGVRISAVDWADGGWTIADSVELSAKLRDAGCDYVTASSGGAVPWQKITVGPGYQVPFAEALRREVDMPIVAVGMITEPAQAEAILRAGSADIIALGRAFLANPRWPWRAAEELDEDIPYPRQYERAHPSMRSADPAKRTRG